MKLDTPIPDSVIITLIVDNDINDIVSLENQCFEKPWNMYHYSQQISGKGSVGFIARKNNSCIGFTIGMIIVPELEILRIAVDSHYRRCGIAIRLINELISLGVANHCESAYLEVDKLNQAALQLYYKSGFVDMYTRKKYYNNTSDALVMGMKIKK